MLLSLMRKHAKSWLIKFFIAIIAIVFIFFYGYRFTSDEGVKVAEVNGEIISGVEYQEAYRDLVTNLQTEYKNVWSDNLIEAFDLKNRALEALINEKIISQEAKRIGLDVTDKEIQEQISTFTDFQSGGSFDKNKYRALLENMRTNPEDFEATISRQVLQEKLLQFMLTFMVVSDQEVMEQYTYFNEQVKISFIQFSPDDFADSIVVDQALMNKYYEEHKEEYRISDKIKIAYIAINPDNFRDQVKLDDQEVINYYEDNQEMFKQEKQVKARHILFRLSDDASAEDEEKVKEKASTVLEKARSGQDFAELAREFSEGPTKEDGGDLGFFPKGRMLKEFEDAAFSMSEGEISDLVKTSYGYHIIKVEEIQEERIKGLDEVRVQIADILIGNESTDLANERALSLIDQMPYDIDLFEYGEQHGVQVLSTDFFSQDEPIPLIEGDSKLRASIFSFQKGEISELIEFNNNFYIIQVTDKQPSYVPDISEVSEWVEINYVNYLAALDARAAAEKYLAELRGGSDWDELAEQRNIEPETTDFFSRMDFPSKIGSVPGLRLAAFKLNENNRYHDSVFEGDDGVFIIRWEDSKVIDEVKYYEERENYRNSIMLAKQQSIYYAWLERLKEHADIDRSPFEKYR